MADVTLTTGADGVEITRVFAASRAGLFACWTTPRLFAVWFGGSGVEVDEVVMDVVEGGAWAARMMLSDGTVIPWRGHFVEIVSPRRLALTLADRDAAEGEAVVVTFDEVDAGTSMTMTQRGGNVDEAQYEAIGQGWLGFFDAMAQLVEAPA